MDHFFFFHKWFHLRLESWESIQANHNFLITLTFVTESVSTFCTAIASYGERSGDIGEDKP